MFNKGQTLSNETIISRLIFSSSGDIAFKNIEDCSTNIFRIL